jgi:peptide methionine sulfoxide reductase MsrB
MNDSTLRKLEKVITQDEIRALQNIVMFQEHDGSYNIYNKYTINKNSDGIYVVSVMGTFTEKSFYKLKNAVAWCSFDKRGAHRSSKRLHQLDQLIFSMDTEIQLHSNLIKRTKNEESKLIYLSKLTQEKAKKRNFTIEIENYLSDFKRWQNILFDAKPKY